MYKLCPPYEGIISVVQRLSDGACIPFDPDNADYQAFLRWCEEGGVPEAAE